MSIPMKNWSPEKILLLIDQYKQHPALWDPSHNDFKNGEYKNEIWASIAETIGCRDVERKMNILIVQFRRELKKIRERMQTGKSEEEAATKWFAFEAMSFLKGKIRKQKRKGPLVSLTASNQCFDQHGDSQNNKWKSIENVEYDQSAFVKTNYDIRDEYSAFGEMVAIKLRKLSNSFAKNKAMNLITNSLFQVEIECSEAECEETEMVFVKTLDDDR